MNRLVFSGSLACVIFLLVATYAFPTNSILWLAGTTTGYTIFRFAMAGMLLAVLFTAPPRRMYMRVLMGSLGLILVGCGVWLSLGDSMHLLDIVLFLELGIAFGIEALEFTEDELQSKIGVLQQQYAQQVMDDPRPQLPLRPMPSFHSDRFIFFSS
jgi:amino acid transporter